MPKEREKPSGGADLGAVARERLDRARKAREARFNAPAWKPVEPGEQVVGKVLAFSTFEDDDGVRHVCTIETEKGDMLALWGSASLEPQLLENADRLTMGQLVACSYDGDRETRLGRTVRQFTFCVLD